MDTTILLVAVLSGYLAGSLSFARLIVRLVAPQVDLAQLRVQLQDSPHSEAVGIFGANAASMVLGARWGLLIAALDMLKVVIPMLVLRALYPQDYYHLAASLGGLLGHIWPLYYRFKGGRGFAVIFGSFIFIDWLGALLCTLGGLSFGMLILGNPLLAYISWLWLMVPWLAWRLGAPGLIYALLVNLIFILATIPEMQVMLRMRRAGTYQAYMAALYDSSPRWRGMKRMAERLWLLRPLFDKE